MQMVSCIRIYILLCRELHVNHQYNFIPLKTIISISGSLHIPVFSDDGYSDLKWVAATGRECIASGRGKNELLLPNPLNLHSVYFRWICT